MGFCGGCCKVMLVLWSVIGMVSVYLACSRLHYRRLFLCDNFLGMCLIIWLIPLLIVADTIALVADDVVLVAVAIALLAVTVADCSCYCG